MQNLIFLYNLVITGKGQSYNCNFFVKVVLDIYHAILVSIF